LGGWGGGRGGGRGEILMIFRICRESESSHIIKYLSIQALGGLLPYAYLVA
jgi:hypothetical protein